VVEACAQGCGAGPARDWPRTLHGAAKAVRLPPPSVVE